MPALPDDVSSVSDRYAHLAELCRESAAKARLAEVARSLRKLAANYDRRAREGLAAEEAVPRRPMFRFAKSKRKAGLGRQKSELSSD